MTTARDILEISLRYVGQETDFSIAPDESYGKGVKKLNQYIEWLREKGITLNSSQTTIDNINQVVNFPSWSIPCIEWNVARLIWPIFNIGTMVPDSIAREASRSQSELFDDYGPSLSAVFPSTLPTGSGNAQNSYSRIFYDGQTSIDTATTNDILTETSTPIIIE